VTVAGLTLGEVGYRLFLLAYGVVFPAYALLCMIPTRRQGVSMRARRVVFAVACLVAYPMAVAGFVLGQSGWLLGLYATLIAARLVVECLPKAAESASG
jgi:hypothetical protein